MKGLVFFKDGHTEEIVEYFDWDEENGVVYFDTASSRFIRLQRYIYMRLIDSKITIITHDISRIELYKENEE